MINSPTSPIRYNRSSKSLDEVGQAGKYATLQSFLGGGINQLLTNHFNQYPNPTIKNLLALQTIETIPLFFSRRRTGTHIFPTQNQLLATFTQSKTALKFKKHSVLQLLSQDSYQLRLLPQERKKWKTSLAREAPITLFPAQAVWNKNKKNVGSVEIIDR